MQLCFTGKKSLSSFFKKFPYTPSNKVYTLRSCLLSPHNFSLHCIQQRNGSTILQNTKGGEGGVRLRGRDQVDGSIKVCPMPIYQSTAEHKRAIEVTFYNKFNQQFKKKDNQMHCFVINFYFMCCNKVSEGEKATKLWKLYFSPKKV